MNSFLNLGGTAFGSSHVNFVFVLFVTMFLKLNRSDDGLANGSKPLTYRRVTVLCEAAD